MTEALLTALIVGVVSPLLLHVLSSWTRRQERAEDRADRKAAAEALAAVGSNLKDVGTKIDGMLVKRDKESEEKGERKGLAAGEEKAAVLAQGQREGADLARASVQANTSAGIGVTPGAGPVPVKDDQAAENAARGLDVQERIAKAAEAQVESAAEESALSKKV